jgi:hypothetical protein
MKWVEWWVEGYRIARENESLRVIPQQKEDVVPPGTDPAAAWDAWRQLYAPRSNRKNPYQPLR